MKDAVDLLNQRIAELEKGIARRDEDCQKLQAIMDENAELEEISGKWEDRYFAAMDNVKQLQAEHRDCLQTITDMQSKWEEVQAENAQLGQWIEIKDRQKQEFISQISDIDAENERLRKSILSSRRYVSSGEQAKDAERYRAVTNNQVEGIAICKEGAYGTPWVAIGPTEAASRIDAAED